MDDNKLQAIREGLRSENLDDVRQAYAELREHAPRLIEWLAEGLYWDDGGYICGFPDGRVEGIDVCDTPFGLWVAWSLLRDSGVLAKQTEIKLHGLREVVFLEGLDQLETLDLRSVAIDGFAFLASVPSVRHLRLAGSRMQPAALADPALARIRQITIEGWKPEALEALASNPEVSLDVLHVASLFPISSKSTVQLIWPKTSVLRIDCPLKPKLGEANYAQVRAVELRPVADVAFCEALAANTTVRCLRSVTFCELPASGSGQVLQAEGLSHIRKVLNVDLVRKHGGLRRREWGYDPGDMTWFSPERQRKARPERGVPERLEAMDQALVALGAQGDIHGFDTVDIHAIACPGLLELLQVMKPGHLRQLHLIDVWEGPTGSVFSGYLAPHDGDSALEKLSVGDDIVFNPSPACFLAKALAEAPGLAGVVSLKLDNFIFRDLSFDVFCALAPLETVETLSLRANLLTEGAGDVLAKHAAKMPRLRHLDLGGDCKHRPGHGGNRLGFAGVSAIAASPLAMQLEYLDLSDNEVTASADPVLDDEGVFPRLRVLRPATPERAESLRQRHQPTDHVTALQQVLDQHPRAVINRMWKIKAESYRRRNRGNHRWDHSAGPEGMTILKTGSTVTVWLMIRWSERQIVVYYFDHHQFDDSHFTLPLTEEQLYVLRCATWPKTLPMPDVKRDLEGRAPRLPYFAWDWS
jgi:hypothetical protein